MDVAGSAVGVASLGIQACNGLLSYYDKWKDYKTDIANAYHCIADLTGTLTLLKDSLSDEQLNTERREHVKKCLQSCEESLMKLSRKSQKLQAYKEPEGLRRRAWSEIQRAWYPLRASTLAKLQEIVGEVQERLKLALQVLQLDVSTSCQRTLAQIVANTRDTAGRTAFIEASLAQLSAQTLHIINAHQSAQLRRFVDWLSPPDPWTNHALARQMHEPETGAWFLRSDQYQKWRSGEIDHVWLHGKAGCGKTILCSTIIEDIKALCENSTRSGYAAFYFSFSDERKQSCEDLLRSLVVQLTSKEPVLSKTFDDRYKFRPGRDVLTKLVLSSFDSYDEVFLLFDALDECPESGEGRQGVLECLEQLSQGGPTTKVKILATSRGLRDVRETMDVLAAEPVPIVACSVDADIGAWVSNQLSHDRRLCKLDRDTKLLIEDTISCKADGMFRWAYCQLQELKRLKSTKPKYVREILLALPATLDMTYERMLSEIEDIYREEALIFLRWLAFSQRPLSLSELAETVIIDPSGDGTVDFQNRGDIQDVLGILSALVVVDGTVLNEANDDDTQSIDVSELGVLSSRNDKIGIAHLHHQPQKSTRIRLAHYSVKEYLESTRIIQSNAKDFHLVAAIEHRFLAQSCLTYILHYSSSHQDLGTFPLIRYAAQSWYYHSYLQLPGDTTRETRLLSSASSRRKWLDVHRPDKIPGSRPIDLPTEGSGLYYASLLGLETTVDNFLRSGCDINFRGGRHKTAVNAAVIKGHARIVELLINRCADLDAGGVFYGNTLEAASFYGHEKIASLLLDKGAKVNSISQYFGGALQAAAYMGHTRIVKMLIDRGANISAAEGLFGSAVQAASMQGHEMVVEMLIDGGAHINPDRGSVSSALEQATSWGHEGVVKMLIKRGANINTEGKDYSKALRIASGQGNERIAKLLLDGGAGINARNRFFDKSALEAASSGGYERVVEMLIERGADVNTMTEYYGSVLQVASAYGHEKVVEILIERGADINTKEGVLGSALQGASAMGRERIVKMLIDRGADIDVGGYYGSALQAASAGGWEKIVKMLIDRGADINAKGGDYGSALQAASEQGFEEVVRMLIDGGADINAKGGHFGSALQAASAGSHERVVEMLIDRGADIDAKGENYGSALQAAILGSYKFGMRPCSAERDADGASVESREKIAKILIDRGADINAKGGDYGSALQAASEQGLEEVVRILIDRGADINARGGQCGSALQVALARGRERVAKILIDAGADLNVKGGYYSSALQAASARGWEKIVKMLIDRGADINAKGGEYGSALQAASEQGFEEVVRMLIDEGADINAKGGCYGSALQAASAGSHESIVKLLIERGAFHCEGNENVM